MIVAASAHTPDSPIERRRLSRFIGLAIVVCAVVTSVASFLILTGQTAVEPTPLVVRGAGIANGLISPQYGLDQGFEEGRGRLGVGALDELHEGELRGPVDGNEEVELAFGSSHFGDIDVEVANRVALEGLLRRLIALDLGQATDAVAQEAAVQGRAGKPWDRRLQGIETIIERQQRVPAEGNDDRFLLKR